MMEASALMSGLTPRRALEKITIGSVLDPGPDTKLAMTRSSSEIVKASIARQFGAALVGGVRHVAYARRLGIPRASIFTGYDAVVEIAADFTRHLAAYQLEATVYHELLHLDTNDKGNLVTVKHDFEGFYAEIDEYGEWRDALNYAGQRFEQLTLAV